VGGGGGGPGVGKGVTISPWQLDQQQLAAAAAWTFLGGKKSLSNDFAVSCNGLPHLAPISSRALRPFAG